MNRTPPKPVLEELRREVGFGCPVPGCGNPYLSWHHFDPPWHEREHHEPFGMIALCQEHHSKADAGAFTREQLRELKRQGRGRADALKGSFDWMRRDLLGVLGGNFYLETRTFLQVRGAPVVWFNRDPDSYVLLNLRLPSISGEPRLEIADNFWMERGMPEDLECPPHGRLVHARYANGDDLRVEFFHLQSSETARARYPASVLMWPQIPFPITAVEVRARIPGMGIDVGPREMIVGGASFHNCLFRGLNVAIEVG